jgi:1,4-alpha-glucan branching enzyme
LSEPLPTLSTPGAWDGVLRGPSRGGLERLLPAWLVAHRWFGGKARRIAAVELLDAAPAGDGPDAARIALLRVRYDDGDAEVYALPLAFASGTRAEAVRAALPGAELAALVAGGEPGLLFAADHDPAFARALIMAIARGRRFAGAAGELVASRTGAFSDADAAAAETVAPSPLGAEQSNTSLRFGDRFVLKLFRRTDQGPNPDLEIGTFLTDVARFGSTPPVLGALEYRPHGGEGYALGLLQRFVPNLGDAWSATLARVEALLARSRGAEPPPLPGALPVELVDASPPPALAHLAGEALHDAMLLGRRTAELHVALASHPEVEAFRPEPFSAADRRALHEEARAVVHRGMALLRARRGTLAPDVGAVADRVLAREDAIERRLHAALRRPLASRRTRVHGDFHLGQVLWTGEDFVIIDFEGEPARSLAARRAKGSPLRDVAGMIRSYHYAAYQGLANDTAAGGERARAEPWARAWYTWAAAAFLRGYEAVAAAGGVLPLQRAELRDLLDLHLVEKAVYELAYELNNRPGWVGLPLLGIAELAEAAPPRPDEEEEPVARKGSREAPRAAARDVKRARSASGANGGAVLAAGGPGEMDLHLWNEGTNTRAYRALGAHLGTVGAVDGTSFAVWAPNAERVTVMGDFNGWDKERHPLRALDGSGVWQGFVPGVRKGAVYKYHLRSRERGYTIDKADPFGFQHEPGPGTQSIVWDLEYAWGDAGWLRARRERNGPASPMSIYEVHLGSWRRVPEEGNRSLGYRELAPQLADYCASMGFTHVELLPITEHPFYGSWGYQTTGYFAPTSRYGSPQDFMFLVDTLHQRGIGVILDWVPSHFPADAHGLAYFDGTHLFEHADRRQGHHPDWDSYIFNYGRNEVRSFLLSSALFWLDRYHLDGLRVDAVASMLYLDYSRKPGEWIPNAHGGRENLEAIAFLRRLNEAVYAEYPDVQTIAEESTAWPAVSRPTYVGGLGFGMKWDMGWMHDTLSYMRHDPVYRRFHHNELTFRMMYAFSESFVLAMSHDEVVHGKRSLLEKMPGDAWEKRANLRLMYGYLWAQPGKKLLFMGGELAQAQEWSHERSLDWHLLGDPAHQGVQDWVRDLNRLMKEEPALHAKDFDPSGFEWVDCTDTESSVIALLRRGGPSDAEVLVVLNFTPIPRHSYRVGVPRGGFWREALNSDAPRYGGSGMGNFGGQEASPVGAHGRHHSLALTLPPLSALFFRREG